MRSVRKPDPKPIKRPEQRSDAALDYRALYRDQRWAHPIHGRRAKQLRAERHCRFCAARGLTVRACIADHIKPHRGDPLLFWSGKLQSLCKPCHDGEKQRREAGKRVGAGTDGYPVDPSHPWSTQSSEDARSGRSGPSGRTGSTRPPNARQRGD